MKFRHIRRLLVLFLAVAIFSSAFPMMAQAAGNGSVVVSANDSAVTVSIDGVGSGGSATVYRVAANAYISGDTLTGKNAAAAEAGTAVGTYACGSKQDIQLPRYEQDGSDNLFDKYYVVKDGTILAGPVYATQIASARAVGAFDTHTKKGITMETEQTIEIAKEMNVGNTVVNLNLSELFVASEDANGNPRDLSGRTGLMEFKSNGKTFYFDANYVGHVDRSISAYSKAGMNVTLVIITFATTLDADYPASLKYFTASTKDQQTLAFNTANTRGMEYWVAAMEMIADRYSKSAETGLVDKFVIGNEIDYAYDWYQIEPMVKNAAGEYNAPVDFDVFMEEYARTVRLANLAVKKYNSEAKVCISLTHNWAESCYQSYNANKKSVRYNSYAPKDMFDWLVENEGARGNYNWGLAVHPYPVGTTPSNPIKSDVEGTHGKAVTGDPDTTPYITVANLELYQLYLQRPENQFNGQTRTVSLTETCICSVGATEPDYELTTRQQAANIAMSYYRAANVPCIDQIAYFQPHDQTTTPYKLGLMTAEGVKKPAYDVWKYIDTGATFQYADPYLKDISNAKSYKELMPAVSSGFDWNSGWNLANIIAESFTVTFKNYDGSVISSTSYRYGDTVKVPSNPTRPAEGDKEYSFIGWNKEVSPTCNGNAEYIAMFGQGAEGVYRVSGSTRYATAFAAADMLKKEQGVDKFQNVVVACGTDFADALSGSYLANQKNAPVLLVRSRNKEINEVKDYIRANLVSGGTVYLLGGEKAIPKTMETGLDGFTVKRLAGANRYDTNLEILKEAGVGNKDILVCTGKDFADGLSASAVNKPILLVKDSLSTNQKAFLESCKGNKIYIIGGTNAISAKLENTLKGYGETTRLEGATRYQTSVNIANTFFPGAKTIVLAYGKNFPDGLSGGAVAYSQGAPLILTASGKHSTAVDYAKANNISTGIALGGTTVLPDATVRKIFRLDGTAAILAK